MSLKPLADRVVIKADEAEDTTKSGLIIASENKEKPQSGKVLEVGPGKLGKDGKCLPMPVKKGDHVIYGKYAGNEIEIDGEELLVVRVDDIYAIL
ncbi:MAG: co-chaperone GroES [Eggerthellaceae bacterium]|nr:co-chaperone GroES [Eggerthellaceae bacterium]